MRQYNGICTFRFEVTSNVKGGRPLKLTIIDSTLHFHPFHFQDEKCKDELVNTLIGDEMTFCLSELKMLKEGFQGIIRHGRK